MSFSNLKRNRGGIDKLINAAETAGGGTTKSYTDERIWKPTVDKVGNGYAVLRFLPANQDQELPWVRYWDHGFKGPTGKWYIERSLTSVGKDDPLGELNSKLWNSGIDADKEEARKQKRRLHYVSNVLVVSDPNNPQNEGKVFMYQYGKKIFDKVMDVMQPQFADETPINPFDFWEGANFKLKIRKVDGYWNYDKSEFDSPTALFDNDGQIEEVWKKAYPLAEFTAASNFKSYDELKQRLDTVLSGTISVGNVTNNMTEERPVASPVVDTTPVEAPVVAAAEEDDTMSYFEKLANNG